jgi:chromosome segregation ATPase
MVVSDKAGHDIREDIRLDSDDCEVLQDELIELRELENMKVFLQEENRKYRDHTEVLVKELEGVEISISANQACIAAYEEKREQFYGNFEKLKARKEALTEEINRIHLQIKAARHDEQSTTILIGNLKQELDEIRTEKAIIGKRLENVRSGIDRISQDRETRLPHLQEYSDLYRKVRTVLKDAQNRMEVTLKLRQKYGTCNSDKCS